MIYISEAHTKLWPLGLEDHPDPQISLEDRIQHAQDFINNEDCPYPVLVDSWYQPSTTHPNELNYEETYHAWPDKYILLDQNQIILAKSTYHKSGENDGKIQLDCVDLLKELISKSKQ